MGDPHFILAGWLIDGSGAPIREMVLLTVVGGVIAGIDRYGSSAAPDPARTTDLSRCTILPPLIDGHVHLGLSGAVDDAVRSAQVSATYDRMRPLIAEHLRQHASHGVFAVRDGGDRIGGVLRSCGAGGGARHDRVIVRTAGRAWHRQGRYGGLLGRHPPPGVPLDEAWALDEEPGDHVKIVNSGVNSLRRFGLQTRPQFSLAELTNVVALARRQGQRVMVHANGREPVRMAIEAGCHSIEHGYFMGRDNLDRLAESATFWVPTLYAMKACAEQADACGLKAERGVAERTLAHQIEQVSLARRAGVRVAAGTDAGSAGVLHGEALTEELKLLMQAGYPLSEAIGCATEQGARLLGLEAELGGIAVGKPAHFLVSRGTPAQLPRKLSYLTAIYRHGRSQSDHRP